MTNEKKIDLPNVLFKAAGEKWGNEDNLWLRENGMVDNLFLSSGRVKNFSVIFKAGDQPWVITVGSALFKPATALSFSRGVNYLAVNSPIIGHPDWSVEQVFNFLIEQIVQMPTVDIDTLARDVFVEGTRFAQGCFAEIINNTGMVPLESQTVGRLNGRRLNTVDYPNILGIVNKGSDEKLNQLFSRMRENNKDLLTDHLNDVEGPWNQRVIKDSDLIIGVDPGVDEIKMCSVRVRPGMGKARNVLDPQEVIFWSSLDSIPVKFPPLENPKELYGSGPGFISNDAMEAIARIYKPLLENDPGAKKENEGNE